MIGKLCVALLVIGPICLEDVGASRGLLMAGNTRRVVSGYEVPIEWVPYQLLLRMYYKEEQFRSICGGSLISEKFVLTAAHCLFAQLRPFNDDEIEVYAGTNTSYYYNEEKQFRQVIKIHVHPKWVPKTTQVIAPYDIAILEVCKPFKLNRNVKPIKLSSPDLKIRKGTEALASGYGDLYQHTQEETPNDLHAVLLTSRKCTRTNITTVICFKGSHSEKGGICLGDSGGPLVLLNGPLVEPVLIGVTSGTSCKMGFGGGTFTSVPMFRNWIRSVTNI